eukprot:2131415-Karenia_brevis.AAC.1
MWKVQSSTSSSALHALEARVFHDASCHTGKELLNAFKTIIQDGDQATWTMLKKSSEEGNYQHQPTTLP